MRIFLSWSGDRSMQVAKALHGWLPLVLQYASPWFSESDLSAGKRWSPELADRLAEASFGILCLTQENVNAPWILFEAGALSKAAERSFVIPYLLGSGFDPLTGPLAQFQAKKADKEGTFDLLKAINKLEKDHPVDPERLQRIFEALWPQLENLLSTFPPAPADSEGTYPLAGFGAQNGQASARPDAGIPDSVINPAAQEELRRLARLLVSEIALYNEQAVEEGRENRDIFLRLGKEIEEARSRYEQAVSAVLRAQLDYFQEELVNILAAGDESLLTGQNSPEELKA